MNELRCKLKRYCYVSALYMMEQNYFKYCPQDDGLKKLYSTIGNVLFVCKMIICQSAMR